MSNTVWIVENHADYEMGNVIGCFWEKEQAVAYAASKVSPKNRTPVRDEPGFVQFEEGNETFDACEWRVGEVIDE